MQQFEPDEKQLSPTFCNMGAHNSKCWYTLTNYYLFDFCTKTWLLHKLQITYINQPKSTSKCGKIGAASLIRQWQLFTKVFKTFFQVCSTGGYTKHNVTSNQHDGLPFNYFQTGMTEFLDYLCIQTFSEGQSLMGAHF